ALLIAARESFGMRTVDAALGETPPQMEQKEGEAANAAAVQFEFQFFSRGRLSEIYLRKHSEGTPPETVWADLVDHTNADEANKYLQWLKTAERWSREDFPKVFEQAGY